MLSSDRPFNFTATSELVTDFGTLVTSQVSASAVSERVITADLRETFVDFGVNSFLQHFYQQVKHLLSHRHPSCIVSS